MPDQNPELCPCGSGKSYAACCQPLHQGEKAASPEALMRSRFSAFVVGLPQYLLDTTHPDHYAKKLDPSALLQSYKEGCETGVYSELTILATDEAGERGMVQFEATYRQGDQESRFGEKSTFVQDEDRWTYLSGELYRP